MADPFANFAEAYQAWIANIRTYNPETGDWSLDSQHILLRFLRDVFFQHDPLDPRCFHWEAGERSRLVIEGTRTTDTSTVESRPAVLVHRGALNYGVTSVDLRHHLDMLTGDYKETDLVTGTLRCHCIAREDLVAERLAVWVVRTLRHFRVMLRQAGFFSIGRQLQMGEIQDAVGLVDGSSRRQWVQVPVIIPIYKQEIVGNTAGVNGSSLLTAVSTVLKGRGVRLVDDKNTFLPYYPLEVDVDGEPAGPHVILQPE